MSTIVISPYNVANFPEGGGHFWVYMQYALGLRALGHDVYWLENFRSSGNNQHDTSMLSEYAARMARYGLAGKLILYISREDADSSDLPNEYFGITRPEAETIFRRADLLLNFHYAMSAALLSRFRRTALIDIDPGLLQFWISRDQLTVHRHDIYFTTGETVGTPAALFPDCGVEWVRIRPAVFLERWPYKYDSTCEAFTTISSWSSDDWIVDGEEVYENTKRISFLQFVELPQLTSQTLELALYLGDADAEDRHDLESNGWRVHHSRDVAGNPEQYQRYIQRSRGEFSCVKPSCIKFQNAWVSDRSLCYLAGGKPVIVQNTGPSTYLPNGEGMFRFSTLAEAVDALAKVNADYERHCRAARRIAETFFDSKRVLHHILNHALN